MRIVLCLGHVNLVKPLSLEGKPHPISSNMKTSVDRGHEAVNFISGTLWLGRWIQYRTLLPRDAVLALHRLHTWLWTAMCTGVLDSHSPIQEGSFTLWKVVVLFLKCINLTWHLHHRKGLLEETFSSSIRQLCNMYYYGNDNNVDWPGIKHIHI